MSEQRSLAFRSQTEVEQRLSEFLSSSAPNDSPIANAQALIAHLYDKNFVLRASSQELLLLNFMAYKGLDHLLTEVEENFAEYDNFFIRNLVFIICVLKVRTSTYTLFSLFTSLNPDVVDFWQNSLIRRMAKRFLLNYFEDFPTQTKEIEKTIKDIKLINEEIKEGERLK